MSKSAKILILIFALSLAAAMVAMPKSIPIKFNLFGQNIDEQIIRPNINFFLFGKHFYKEFDLKMGLDIQSGMQVVLKANMDEIDSSKREDAIKSAKEIISRRVDLFGINEPVIRTSKIGEDYRLIVELPGITDPEQALQLVGKTAQLDFRLEASSSAEATSSAVAFFNNFESTGLTGRQLESAQAQFSQQTSEPVIALEFNNEGRDLFAEITKAHTGKVLAIFIDDFPVAMPMINDPILDGQAIMTGGFDIKAAKQLAIQLNAGALPVPIEVLEQKNIGATLGEKSVQASVRAGLIGLALVILFMVLYYGFRGVLASLALIIYAILTIAIYKLLGITLTLPGIAGMILTIGMAVDSNILIFERIKEELRTGRHWQTAMELGFGKAWDSIKDANLATILTSLVLINPLNFNFLNTSGLVKGFGITLLIGVLVSLFTGIVVSRNLMRVFLPIINNRKKQIK